MLLVVHTVVSVFFVWSRTESNGRLFIYVNGKLRAHEEAVSAQRAVYLSSFPRVNAKCLLVTAAHPYGGVIPVTFSVTSGDNELTPL